MNQKISDKIEIITDEALGILHDLATINVTDQEKVEAVMSSVVSRAGKIIGVGTLHRNQSKSRCGQTTDTTVGFYEYMDKHLDRQLVLADVMEIVNKAKAVKAFRINNRKLTIEKFKELIARDGYFLRLIPRDKNNHKQTNIYYITRIRRPSDVRASNLP